MVVGREAAQTPSLFNVFSLIPLATINGGAHYIYHMRICVRSYGLNYSLLESKEFLQAQYIVHGQRQHFLILRIPSMVVPIPNMPLRMI
jgi:hypothetical protein